MTAALWTAAFASFGLFAATVVWGELLPRAINQASYVAFFIIVAVLCVLRAVRGVGARAPWFSFALGFLLQAAGWAYFFLVTQHLEAPPYPSLGDVLWLSYYAGVFVGLLLLLRMRLIAGRASLWADAVIATAALGSVGAAILVDPLIASTGGEPEAVATNLAYPMSDLLVLTLVVAAFAMTSWRPGRLWTVIGVAFAIQIGADVIYLSRAASGTYEPGTILDSLWMVVALLITYAAWRPSADPKPHVILEGWRMFAPPAVFTVIAVAVLVYGTVNEIHPSATVLAVLALLGSIARMMFDAVYQRQLTDLAQRDPLTQLLNHRAFHLAVERHMQSAPRVPMTVVLFDVDGFKAVNDSYGHAEGDRVLRQVANALRRTTRAQDQVGRLGGDEFGVLLPDTLEAAATAIAERVQVTVAELDAAIGISFGVAEWPLHGSAKDLLMLRADMSLYEAKPGAAEGRRLQAVAEATRLDSAEVDARIRRFLTIARDQLGMSVAYFSEFSNGQQVFRGVAGDGESFGLRPGGDMPLEETYCQRVISGELPNVVRDTRADDRVNSLAATKDADLGAYIGVPITFSDGQLYGTLCCASHKPEPGLAKRDVEFMQVIAKLLGDELEREQRGQRERLIETQTISLHNLLAALDARDRYTGEHSADVVELAGLVARQLRLSEANVTTVKQVALLHDIGKIGIPDAILHKNGRLTEDEWRLMREHPEIGARLVDATEPLAHLAPMVRAEHERWDGRGYPDGLSGEQIPLASRIVFACDAYDAMTSDRPYRQAMGSDDARQELEANAGTQFDPGVVAALLTVLERRARCATDRHPDGQRLHVPASRS